MQYCTWKTYSTNKCTSILIEELGLLGIHGRKFGVFLVRKNCQVSNQIHPRSIPCPPRASPVGAFPSAAGAKGSHENRVCPNEIICLFGNPCKAPLYTRLNWAVHLADSTRHLKNKSYHHRKCCLPVCRRCFTRTLRMKSWLLLPCRTT